MLYKLLKYLFHDDDYSRYTPKPWHMIYPVLMLAVGTITLGLGWSYFGFVVSALGKSLYLFLYMIFLRIRNPFRKL